MSEPKARHRLAAILAADAAGYSRVTAEDDRVALATLVAARVFRRRTEARTPAAKSLALNCSSTADRADLGGRSGDGRARIAKSSESGRRSRFTPSAPMSGIRAGNGDQTKNHER